ncbi:MAG: 5-formyltetrahydrofolate cyclo-ligase [Verrucomicrobiia bacterium]
MDTDKHGLDKTKAKLRSEIRGVLNNLSPERRVADSAKVRALLPRQPFWKAAATILFFAPLPNEVDIWPLLAEAVATGKIVALPRFNLATGKYTASRVQHPQSEIVTGKFGIREPAANCAEIPLNRFDLVLVPGVAFDALGHRLGRGRGFFDRLLAEVGGAKCGVAFDEQIMNAVPAGKLDVRMNFVLTPTRCAET